MKPISIIIILMSLCRLCMAEVDLSSYNLTTEQIKIIRKLEAKGSLSDKVLIKLAKASQKHNEKEIEYIPPHTIEQLEQVKAWAIGGVIQSYAKRAGLDFNNKAYMDNYPVYIEGKPNMALFNFGLATGDEFFEIDIMTAALSVQSNLIKAEVNLSTEEFEKHLIQTAKYYDFLKFLIANN